jgi:hypothetical protein
MMKPHMIEIELYSSAFVIVLNHVGFTGKLYFGIIHVGSICPGETPSLGTR